MLKNQEADICIPLFTLKKNQQHLEEKLIPGLMKGKFSISLEILMLKKKRKENLKKYVKKTE